VFCSYHDDQSPGLTEAIHAGAENHAPCYE
jgi:hypothetical protein